MEETFLQRYSVPFSPLEKNHKDDKALVTRANTVNETSVSKLHAYSGNSSWRYVRMIDDGCGFHQTFQVMKERCKSCSVISPMFCVDHCETWKVKRELRKISKVLSRESHELELLNALKNERRLAILNLLQEKPLTISNMQVELRNHRFNHSKNIVNEYLRPLSDAGLVKKEGERFQLTLYGRKIHQAVRHHGFNGDLPVHSVGHEERILRCLIDGPKTRKDLQNAVPAKILSRILKRLQELGLIRAESTTNHIFYFRTRRPLHLEKLSPTQRRICCAIPSYGISTSSLSDSVGINLRRTYKYLRNLRGKKLVFRREKPVTYELTDRGKAIAEFLEEIVSIRMNGISLD
jgi:predicted transcriptional regulator